MNTPTPTPRTDAAWAQTFDANEFLSGRGNAATDMRDEAAKLERELTALTSERDQLNEMFHQIRLKLTEAGGDPYKLHDEALECLISERGQLRAEVERLRSDRDCEKRLRKDADEFRENAIERAERAEAEVERCNDIINRASVQFFHDGTDGETAAKMLTVLNEAKPCELCGGLALGQENCDAAYDELRVDCDELRADVVRLTARAERAEAAETVALANWNGALERAMKAEADLAAAKERLRSEAMDDYASIKDLQRELATERARLRQVALDACKSALIKPMVWSPSGYFMNPKDLGKINEQQVEACFAAIDAAMKEGAK